MSQSAALAQNVTQIPTTRVSMDEWPVDLIVAQTAAMKLGKNASGKSIEKISLNRSKLETSVLNQFRCTYPEAMIGDSKNIPAAFHQKIRASVLKFCDETISATVKDEKLENLRKSVSFKPNFKDHRVDTAVIITGTKQIDLVPQLTHCDVHIEYLQDQLRKRTELNSKPSLKEPDYEKERQIKERLQKWYDLRAIIQNNKAMADKAAESLKP